MAFHRLDSYDDNSSSSGSGYHQSYDDSDDITDEYSPSHPTQGNYQSLESSSSFPRYQPGRYLEPIHTGETLQIDEHSTVYTQSNPSSLGHPTQSYDHSASEDYYSYPEYASDPRLAQAYTPVDINHFQYDAEASAYSSGTGLRSVPPRSRSPTPAAEDEDYYVVGNDSYHYTGSDYPQSGQHDPEKFGMNTNYSSQYASQHAYYPSLPTPTATEPITPVETRHFGPAPSGRVTRRHNMKKRVQLTRGNLVIDLPVPPNLVLPRTGDREMMQTRYTAVTCNPDEFSAQGFSLRQVEMHRTTELFIVITMFNVRITFVYCAGFSSLEYQEDEILFCRTMYGVMKNIQHLCTRKNSQTWGTDAWKKVLIHT